MDNKTKKEFKAKGLEPFTYSKKSKELKMSYYEAPEGAIEDRDEMEIWAKKAYKTALKVASKKSKK